MPPKKAIGKKSSKIPAPLIEAEKYNNGVKGLTEDLISDPKMFSNGIAFKDADDTILSPKSNTTKRSGRIKNVATNLDTVATPVKKPATKGRGKKKSNENEVIEIETVNMQPETESLYETTVTDGKKKPKGRGGGRKAETKVKNMSKGNGVVPTEGGQEEDSNTASGKELQQKITKTASWRKSKKEEFKMEHHAEIEQELAENFATEKVPKKASRNLKKAEEPTESNQPQKKRGRIAKTEKSIEKNEYDTDTAVPVLDKVKTSVKQKKLGKRVGNIVENVIAAEDISRINGDNGEAVPKKRTRKASTIENEILKEKPKRGRAKNIDNAEEKSVENKAEISGTQAQNSTNGVGTQEKRAGLEETPTPNSNKKDTTPPDTKATTKAKVGRKRAAPLTKNIKISKSTEEDEEKVDDGVDNADIEDELDGSKPSKTKKSKNTSAPLNATGTKYNKADFELTPPSDGQADEEPRFNLKISSWNVAGLRSWLKKDGLKFLDYEQPDIFCMQETKCTNDQLPDAVAPIPGYHPYWLCMPGGYAGVAIYSKIMPINVEYGIGNKEFDACGRIITAEFEKFFLVNVYVPNSGRKLVNLEARMKWEELFQQFIQSLDARKPVVICGDMNVSHQEHDLANPKTNTRNAGFTKEERDKMTELLQLGYVDSFRHLYPERKGAYTFWTYMGNARSRNVGWRLDYFIVSERFIKRVVDNCIRSQCMGSDHCPITLFLKL